jgi:hypothetical protein
VQREVCARHHGLETRDSAANEFDPPKSVAECPDAPFHQGPKSPGEARSPDDGGDSRDCCHQANAEQQQRVRREEPRGAFDFGIRHAPGTTTR